MKKLLLITIIIGLTSCSNNTFYSELDEFIMSPEPKISDSGKLLHTSFNIIAPHQAFDEPSKAVHIRKSITEHCYTPNDMICFFKQLDYSVSIIKKPSVIKSGDIQIDQNLMNNCHQQYHVFLIEQNRIDYIFYNNTENRTATQRDVFPIGLDHYPVVIIRPYKSYF